ncbi:MAG: nitroreductase family protein [Candidatus Latescibacteria bacterium]|nr:nitroreductase family protein [Candidatus Latescibacterota bacterium]
MIQNSLIQSPVLRRRSIRKYIDRPIEREAIKMLLQAGMAAPSAEDERPWHFIVINDSSMRNLIPFIHPDMHILKNAPALILVCGDLTRQKASGFWIQDCSASTENILIEAQLLNMGAVWLGIYPIEGRIDGFRQFFQIPEHIIPFSIIAIGYPGEYKEPADRYDESRVHYQKW